MHRHNTNGCFKMGLFVVFITLHLASLVASPKGSTFENETMSKYLAREVSKLVALKNSKACLKKVIFVIIG